MELETVEDRIGNSGVQNWKQWGTELETAGHGIGNSRVWN